MICKAGVSGSRQAPEMKRHAVSGGHGVGHRPPVQAGLPVAHGLTMIHSFSDQDTKELVESVTNRRFATFSRVALRKSIQMNQARELRDLAVPPGSRLEAFKGRLSRRARSSRLSLSLASLDGGKDVKTGENLAASVEVDNGELHIHNILSDILRPTFGCSKILCFRLFR